MADERKSILLRIPPELWAEISRAAQRDLRSTNAQIEFLLRLALRGRGKEGGDGSGGGEVSSRKKPGPRA